LPDVTRLDSRAIANCVVEEVWNKDDHSRVNRLLNEECVFVDAGRSARPAPLRLVDLVNTYKAFVPDLTLRISRQTPEGSRLKTDWEGTGRHFGMVNGLPPTGRQITLGGQIVTDARKGGRVVKGVWDRSSLLRQVGVSSSDENRLRAPRDKELVMRARYDADGVPLLLFPTMSLPGWLTWKRVSDALTGRTPVITFQMFATRRAFEHVAEKGYRLERENDLLRDTLGLHGMTGPYDIVGHSIGGLLALHFALTSPELTRSMTLIEPGLPWLLAATGSLDDEISNALSWRRTFYRRISPERYARFLQQTYREEGYDPKRSPRWPLLCAYRGNMAYRESVLRHRDQPKRLRSLRCPVLLIQGSSSDPFHHAVIRQLRASIPHASFVEMSGGHAPHYGAGTATFISHLTRFLSAQSLPFRTRLEPRPQQLRTRVAYRPAGSAAREEYTP
jgi:pimeloyl-ACP methyl ester carboxylesterase